MANENPVIGEMVKIMRTSFHTGINSMDAFHMQTEKTIEVLKNNTNMLQGEVNSMLHSWLVQAKNAQRSYTTIVEEGLDSIEKMVRK